MRDLAVRAVSGLPLRSLSRLDDEEVVEALVAVKGIGRWTAEMFLMFRLLRPDVLPVGDYGIRKAMQRAYRLRKLPKPDRHAADRRALAAVPVGGLLVPLAQPRFARRPGLGPSRSSCRPRSARRWTAPGRRSAAGTR